MQRILLFMQKTLNSGKERNPLQSVIFQLDESIDAFNALEEISTIHKKMLASNPDANLPLSRSNIVPLVGITRDSFCMRLAYLFDRRRDVHSLKKYFKGEAIDDLLKHPITQASIAARNGNIAHMGKEYVKWPNVNDILASDIRERLKGIKLGVLFPVDGGVK